MKKILILLLSGAFLAGCADRLDEVRPTDSLTPDAVFIDAAGAEAAALAAYSFAQSANALNGTPQLMGEWQSDNVNFVGSFPTFQDVSLYVTRGANTSTAAFYEQAYDVIGSANILLANVDGVDELTDTRKSQLTGEAKFMRALMYLQLADLFGQPLQQGGRGNLSVQLVLDADATEGPQRATLGEVHDQIEADLLDAIASDLDNSDNSRATKGAAQALLARLYLYQERFGDAARLANDAISNPEFSLGANYSFFGDTSGEHFFTLVNSANEPQPAQGYISLTNPVPGGRGDAPLSQNLINAYAEEPDDLRFALVTAGIDAEGNVSFFSTKFPDAIVNADNAPVLRVTEAYCIRAEANLRNTSTIGATPLADINALRSRAGLPALTGTVTLDIILNEKRKELAFEGQRRMDLLRNGRNLRRAGMNNVTESAPGQSKTILPIPTTQVDLDNLNQNADY